MPELVIPFTLTADSPARAGQVMANFNAIKTLLNGTKLGQDNIQANAIVAGLIATGAVTTPKIDDDAVVTRKIADEAVTTAKMAVGSVTGDRVALNYKADVLQSTINNLPTSWTDICSVSFNHDKPVQFLVVAEVQLREVGGATSNTHLSLTWDGGDHETGDIILTPGDFGSGVDRKVIPISAIIRSTNDAAPIKLRAQRVDTTSGNVDVIGNNEAGTPDGFGLTRLAAVRIS